VDPPSRRVLDSGQGVSTVLNVTCACLTHKRVSASKNLIVADIPRSRGQNHRIRSNFWPWHLMVRSGKLEVWAQALWSVAGPSPGRAAVFAHFLARFMDDNSHASNLQHYRCDQRCLALILIKGEYSRCEHDPCLTNNRSRTMSERVSYRSSRGDTRCSGNACADDWNAPAEAQARTRVHRLARPRWPAAMRQDSM
jgi:hypothetical protein